MFFLRISTLKIAKFQYFKNKPEAEIFKTRYFLALRSCKDNKIICYLATVFLATAIATKCQTRYVVNLHYYMACSCSRSNAGSDWVILRHYSPVMPTGQSRARKDKAKSQIINNSLTSNLRFLLVNLKPGPYRNDLAIA